MAENPWHIEPLTSEEELIVWQMLMITAQETSLSALREQEWLARYAQNWGRDGDLGFWAFIDEHPIGAAWIRLWPEDHRGWGFVETGVPELAIGVVPIYQKQGIGTALLTRLLTQARTKFPAVSLNVRSDNPAVGLYQRFGFITVPGSETRNRVGGTSFNMILRFDQGLNSSPNT